MRDTTATGLVVAELQRNRKQDKETAEMLDRRLAEIVELLRELNGRRGTDR